MPERKLKLEEGILYRLLYNDHGLEKKMEAWAVYSHTGKESRHYFQLNRLVLSVHDDDLLEAWEMPSSSKPKLPVSLGSLQADS
jgi:hypothetical protein